MEDKLPDLNEQVLFFHSFSFQPAYQRAFRTGASEAQYPVRGNQAVGNMMEEGFEAVAAKVPRSLKGHSEVVQASRGSRIVPEDGNPEPYI